MPQRSLCLQREVHESTWNVRPPLGLVVSLVWNHWMQTKSNGHASSSNSLFSLEDPTKFVFLSVGRGVIDGLTLHSTSCGVSGRALTHDSGTLRRSPRIDNARIQLTISTVWSGYSCRLLLLRRQRTCKSERLVFGLKLCLCSLGTCCIHVTVYVHVWIRNGDE